MCYQLQQVWSIHSFRGIFVTDMLLSFLRNAFSQATCRHAGVFGIDENGSILGECLLLQKKQLVRFRNLSLVKYEQVRDILVIS
jgi:hypothetical protein